jgi:protein-tyrosine phosphatase
VSREIKEKDIAWSDMILVMEDKQSTRINERYRHLELPIMHVLDIADEYEYLDNHLIEILSVRIDAILKSEWQIWRFIYFSHPDNHRYHTMMQCNNIFLSK